MSLLRNIWIRDSLCSIEVEDKFGPTVEGCYGGFDFTLLFEEAFLSITPSALFILLTVYRIFRLRAQPVKVVNGISHISKLVALGIYSVFQLVLLGLCARPSTPKTHLSIASACLAFLAALGFCYLSHLEHRRSIRPSEILNIYFFFTVLFDIPRTRTLWAIDGLRPMASLFIASLVSKVFIFALEVIHKRDITKIQYVEGAPETWSGIFDRGLFLWQIPLFFRGAKKSLSIQDLFSPEQSMAPEATEKHKLVAQWEKVENKDKSNALLGPILRAYKWEILSGVFPRLCQTAFTFTQPFLLQATVDLLSDEMTPNTKNSGYGLICAYAIVYIGIAISTAQAQHKAYRLIAMLRGALIPMIYDKTMSLSSNIQDDSAALTLMSADIERITSGLRYLYDAFISLIEMAISLWLLYRQLSAAGIAPIVIAFICTGGAMRVAVTLAQKQKLWMEGIQKRVAVTADMLGVMKGVKMLGLATRFSTLILNFREKEIAASKKFRLRLIAVVGLAFFNMSMAPVITFTIFSLISHNGRYGYLDSSRALTSLTLFGLFSTALGLVVEGATGIMTSLDCIDRIREYLAQLPRKDGRCRLDDGFCVQTKCANVGWKQGKPFILHDLNMKIKNNTLTMIIGPVGCGKSTLMKALIGETPVVEGQIQVNFDTAAYCSQVPWLSNGTVQQNILSDSNYDLTWYLTVIDACGLQQDFANLPEGDKTVVGSKGVSLSGGQKQRLTLARAIYSKEKTIILDDVMSGLDPVTEEHIFSKLLGPGGLVKACGSTVIMVSNSVHRLPYADHIIALGSDGRIVEQGSFKKVQQKLDYIEDFQSVITPPFATQSEIPNLQPPFGDGQIDEISDADRRTGDLESYRYYFSCIGWGYWFVLFVLMAIYIFLESFPSVWVTWWAEDNDKQPNLNLAMRLGVFWLLGILSIFFLVLTAWFLMIQIVPMTARVLHRTMLRTVVNAPMSFFASTDSGVTINRFSQDLELIDMELPLALLNTSFSILTVVAQLIIISVSAKYITATIPACIATYYFVQRFYLKTSRQLRVMDIEAKSPLFSHFLETLNGVATIRAFAWEEGYKARNSKLLSDSQRPFYLLYSAQRWLNLVLDMSVAGFVVVLIGIAVATIGDMSSSFIGLALVNVASLSDSIKSMITQWTVLEASMGAVTRVKNFTQSTESEHLPSEKDLPPDNWPQEGSIEFKNVCAYYKTPDKPALNKVSFTIKKGEKVGICGRSGSGKSSLVSAIFRMIELSEGAIIVNGVDLSTIPREEVRTRIIGLPQDPCLLSGTVRENIDPHDYNPEERIIDTLKKVDLWDTIAVKGGLEAMVTPDFLSQGQQQLLCLAKAMLRQGNIIVFDEATSSVDIQTDEFMQNIIRTYFADYTVISVTHRLDTIIDYDRVMLLENGVLVENDDPRVLLASPSKFRVLYQSSRGWEEYERRERAEKQKREQELAKVDELESEKPARPPSPASMVSAEDTQNESDIRTTIREYWAIVSQMSRLVGAPSRERASWRNSTRARNRRSQVLSHVSRSRGDRMSYTEIEGERSYQPRVPRRNEKRWSYAGESDDGASESWTTDEKKRSWHGSIPIARLPSVRRNSIGGMELVSRRSSHLF